MSTAAREFRLLKGQTSLAVQELRDHKRNRRKDRELTPEEAARLDLYRSLDYYPTPPWAARAGAELILRHDPGALSVGEPACGEGHMAAPMAEHFPFVHATDIHPFGYGAVADFMDQDAAYPDVDWIATNPPFIHAQRFFELAWERANRGVALLGRVALIEGCARFPMMSRLTRFAPFCERVPMVLGEWDPKAASATAYAWFLWMKGEDPRPPQLIPPGTRARLWRATDERRFARLTPAPLLAGLNP